MANIDKNELFGSFLPKPFIEKVSLNNNKITVKINVKQNFQNAENSNLLEKLGLLDHFTVKVFEVQDGRISSLINFSKEFLFLLDGKGPKMKNVINFAKNYLEEPNSDIVRKILKDSCIILEKPFRLESEEGFSEEDIEVLDDGTQVHNKYFSFAFDHKQGVSELGHISYYVIIQLDDEFFIKNNIVDLEIKKAYRSLIEVQGENIFNDFELTGESYVFLDESSKIWTGDVYEKEQVYYTGFWDGRPGTEPNNSKRLVRRIIRNNVIEDIRKREVIDKTAYNIRTYESYIPKFTSKNSNIDYKFFKKPEVYVSNFNIDSTDNDQCRGSFMFHLNRFLKDNNFYTKNISQDADFFNNLDLSSIKNIKILRKRVLKRYSGDEEVIMPFSKNELEYPLINVGSLGSTDSLTKENNNCRIVMAKNNIYNTINIEFIDKQVSKFSDGIYQYFLEMEIYDPSYDYIKQQITLLKEQYSNLQIYYNNSQEPKMYSFEQNKFKREFNNEINQEYIINAIAIFNQVRSNLDLEEDEEMTLKISNMTSPSIGTPEGILVFIKILDNFIKNLQYLIGDKENLQNQAISFRKNKTSMKLNYMFKEHTWDANRNTLTYDYGIDKKIQSSDFLNLVNEYLGEEASEEDKEMQIPFLSPTRISRLRRVMSIEDSPRNLSRKLSSIKSNKSENIENSDFKEAFYELSRDFNISIEEYQIPKKEKIKVVEKTIEATLGKKENTPQGNLGQQKDTVKTINPENSQIFNRKPFFGQLVSVFNEIPKSKKEAPICPGRPYKPVKRRSPSKRRRKPDIKEIIKSKIREREESNQEQDRKLPPHVRNIFDDNSERNNRKRSIPPATPSNFLEVKTLKKITIAATKKVEILTGFDRNLEGKIDPKKPKWESISKELINNFNNGSELQCRIVDFKDTTINIEDPTKGQKIKNSNFSLIVQNNRTEEIAKPKIEINSGTRKKSITVNIDKEKYEKIAKNNFEQTKYPPALSKTIEVSKKTVSQAISEPKVLKEAQKQINEKNKRTTKGANKVGPKAAAAVRPKKKNSKKGRSRKRR